MTSTENKPAPRELAIDLEEMKAYPLIHAHKDFVCFIEKEAFDQLQKENEELNEVVEANKKISLLHQDKNIVLHAQLAEAKRELENLKREIVKPKYEVGAHIKYQFGTGYGFGVITEVEIRLSEKQQTIKYQVYAAGNWSWYKESAILGTFTMDGQDE